MKYLVYTSKFIVASLLAVGSLLMSGCIREDLDDCYYLHLKVLNEEGDEITGSGDVGASLFVYDENGIYQETIELSGTQVQTFPVIKLNYPESKKLQIVSWSNDLGSTLLLTKGDRMEELQLKVQSSSDGLAPSPEQVYYGNIDVTTIGSGAITHNDTIVLRPQMGQIRMTTEGFQYYLKKQRSLRADFIQADCDYLVDNALNAYDYKADRTGTDIFYRPDGEWADDGEFKTPLSTVCSGDTLTVDLNKDKGLVGRQDVDMNGVPIVIPPGENRLVVFVFDPDGSFVGVRVEIRPWGVVDDEIIL